jgi:hypothetical protein
MFLHNSFLTAKYDKYRQKHRANFDWIVLGRGVPNGAL